MKEKRFFNLLSIIVSVTLFFPLMSCSSSKNKVSKFTTNNKYNESNSLKDSNSNEEITDNDIKQITKDEMNDLVSKYKIFANNAIKITNYLMEDPISNKDNCVKLLSDMKKEKKELSKVVPDCLRDDLNNYMEQFISISEQSLNNGKYNYEDYNECDNNRYNFEIKAKAILKKLHMNIDFY